MKVYIAGPITNTPDFRERFAKGCEKVVALGFTAVSPVTDNPNDMGDPKDWAFYMRKDIPLLLNCDGIYMLNGWENSRGARLEHYIAQQLSMRIFDEGTS